MKTLSLSTAYATQTTTENGKGEWIVYNERKEIIHRLPSNWTEKQVMTAIHMGREFELRAFNEGVNYEKSLRPEKIKYLESMVKSFSEQNDIMRKENIKISDELDKLTLKYN